MESVFSSVLKSPYLITQNNIPGNCFTKQHNIAAWKLQHDVSKENVCPSRADFKFICHIPIPPTHLSLASQVRAVVG